MSITCVLPSPGPTSPKDSGQLSSAELVGAAIRSEDGAWEALVQRYRGTVTAITRNHRLNQADAADVAQTVWLRLFEHIHEVRRPDRVGAWVATTARRECIAVWRHHRRVTPGDESLEELPAAPGPELEVETGDRDACLRLALDTLPRRQNAILTRLTADPAPSYLQIATDLDIAVGSIGPTRQRGLETLRTRCLDWDICLG